jgi:hemerythrin superfamily protein
MSAIDMLEMDHREIEELFEDVEGSEDVHEKKQTFDLLADKLAVHASLEERLFYPAVKERRTKDILLESLEEHLAMKRTLADLLALEIDDEAFDAKLAVLHDQVQLHAQEEERELFPKVRRLFDSDELDALEQEMSARQEDLIARGRPRNMVPRQTAEAARI